MFELNGKYITARYYARTVPWISWCVYEMSYASHSSVFYKTQSYITRLIDLQSDFESGYSKRLWYHIRKSEEAAVWIERPDRIPDLDTMYKPIQRSKKLNPLPPQALESRPNYYYSVVHHPALGRLAAHLTIGDPEEKRAFQFINASAYRSFSRNTDKQLCSSANKYLYYQDMLFFRDLGYRYFDFVGTKEPMNQFKKQFGGDLVTTYYHIPYPILWFKALRSRVINYF